MRKRILALLSILVVTVILGCAHVKLYEAKHLKNQCPGTGKNEGMVCIDPNTLAPSQNPVHVRSGNFAHFFVTGGRGHLTITYEKGTPVDYVGHENDHAWVHAQKVAKSEKHKYTIDLDGRRLDPEMVIDP